MVGDATVQLRQGGQQLLPFVSGHRLETDSGASGVCRGGRCVRASRTTNVALMSIHNACAVSEPDAGRDKTSQREVCQYAEMQP